MLDNGRVITKRDGEFISGFSQRVKGSISEIDMREIGKKVKGKALEFFTMPMDPNIKGIGRRI